LQIHGLLLTPTTLLTNRSTNQLGGTLPAEGGASWPKMVDLELQRNVFIGTIPSSWAGMHKLQRLLLQ